MGKNFLKKIFESTSSTAMHVKKNERQVLYAYLLNEGVATCKKQNTGKHDATKLDNLKVFMLLRSMESRGFATCTFSWQHNYFSVTSEGIEFLRQQLGIANEKVYPKTHQPKRQAEVQQVSRAEGDRRGGMGRGGFRGDRTRGGFRGDRGAPRNE